MGVLFKFTARTGNEAEPVREANATQQTKEQTADKETQFTFPLSAGLLEPKYVKTIASAVWTFLWCINRTTHVVGDSCRMLSFA